MKGLKLIAFVCIGILTSAGCNNGTNTFDASGSFEADETIISAEASGVIKQFNIDEGQVLHAGQLIGYIDSTQLYLKKMQVLSQINALLTRRPDVSLQLAALYSQLETNDREKVRITNLIKGGAATTKQLDDMNASIDYIRKQIEAQKSALEITRNGIGKDATPLYLQIDQLNDQLMKCRILNPINGTVLMKYARQSEMTSPGKALYKIADLSTMILRAYITGNQLMQVKLNQLVKVYTDDGDNNYRVIEGKVTWINDKGEFTPKTIQTKDERANMVYALKVKVVNDGSYKIGMYGEIRFKKP